MTKKPVAVVLPSWNPNEPRFVIENATEYISDDRTFKNGKCVYNQRLGFAYSIDEIVEALNNDELEKENERLKKENKELRDFEYWVFKSIDKVNQKNGDIND